MVLENTDILAIIIALAGACVVMVVGIREQGRLSRENRRLREKLIEMKGKN
jgi:hypothetical protein